MMKNDQFLLVLAAVNRNTTERLKSSSGGVYTLLAQRILKEKGSVFAVRYTNDLETEHYEITSLNELTPSLGAKYIPSKLSGIFPLVRKRLLENKKVLFVGLPCQCAGLKSFLKNDYENLFLVDTICHGIPSNKAWRAYLDELNTKGQVQKINMRDKTLGWSNYNYDWKIKYLNKDEVISQNQIPYMTGFVNDLYLRPSCYDCQFKGTSRITDLTLGDFWGIWDLDPMFDDNKGTSLLLIHSKKGKDIIDKLNLDVKEVSVESAVNYNLSIVQSAELPKKRKIFFEELNKGKSFSLIILKIQKKSFLDKLKTKLRR